MLSSILKKFAGYVKELRFAWRAGSTWRDSFLLTRETLVFHVGNLFGIQSERAYDYQLRLGNQTHSLRLRTFAGDLFILHEILTCDTYFIPNASLSPEDVNVILDCGANVGICSLYFSQRYPNARIV